MINCTTVNLPTLVILVIHTMNELHSRSAEGTRYVVTWTNTSGGRSAVAASTDASSLAALCTHVTTNTLHNTHTT